MEVKTVQRAISRVTQCYCAAPAVILVGVALFGVSTGVADDFERGVRRPSRRAQSAASESKVKARVCRRVSKEKPITLKCSRTERLSALTQCDADKDMIKNRDEHRRFIRTNPFSDDTDSDGLTDGFEMCTSHSDPNDSDSDNDGVPDGQDPDSNKGPPDSSTVCDAQGNTSGFGIPAGVVGNVNEGDSRYHSTCTMCHSLSQGIRGENVAFSVLAQALRSPPMNLNLSDQVVAHLAAYLNRAKCTDPSSGGGGGGTNPTPSPSAEPTPTATPSSGACTPQGDTASFGIPAGQTGNIGRGTSIYQMRCSGCHPIETGTNLLYPAVAQWMNVAPMSTLNTSLQERVDLVAYLNRSNCGANSPSPTPTLTPVAAGQQLFISMCSSCHDNSESSWTANKISKAFREKREMRNLGWTPTAAQLSLLAAYTATTNGDD